VRGKGAASHPVWDLAYTPWHVHVGALLTTSVLRNDTQGERALCERLCPSRLVQEHEIVYPHLSPMSSSTIRLIGSLHGSSSVVWATEQERSTSQDRLGGEGGGVDRTQPLTPHARSWYFDTLPGSSREALGSTSRGNDSPRSGPQEPENPAVPKRSGFRVPHGTAPCKGRFSGQTLLATALGGNEREEGVCLRQRRSRERAP